MLSVRYGATDADGTYVTHNLADPRFQYRLPFFARSHGPFNVTIHGFFFLSFFSFLFFSSPRLSVFSSTFPSLYMFVIFSFVFPAPPKATRAQ